MKALLNYFHPLERIKRKRKQYLGTVKLPEALHDLVEQPCPEMTDLAKDSEYIVLDLETTGLDSEQDLILSMGWVNVVKGESTWRQPSISILITIRRSMLKLLSLTILRRKCWKRARLFMMRC